MMKWYRDELSVSFIQGWGMTEMNPLGSLGVAVTKLADKAKNPDDLLNNIMKAGYPVTGMEVRIAVQDDLDKDVEPGEPGELLVKSPWVIQTYFKNPAPDKFH